ncbi:MAG: GNAT family N-acetyltransferase, partial [Chloroflexota bacterium]
MEMVQYRIDRATIIRELDGGLVMRRATPDDAEALSDFNARIHIEDGQDHPDEGIRAWTHDLLTIPHPTFQPGDFTIVEEAATGKIVSSLNLISQTWAYGGIPFGVGRPELVGTLPEYRNRGLVRLQFDVAHQWSAERGEKVQAITGIPYYYRLFGYEMTLNLGGGRAGFKPQVPKLKEGEAEPYRVRPAAEADIPFITEMYAASCLRSLVHCVWDESLWKYELNGKTPKNGNRMNLRII